MAIIEFLGSVPPPERFANCRGLSELNARSVIDPVGRSHVEQAVRAVCEERHQIREVRVPR